MLDKWENPKSEYRNPKQIQNTKAQMFETFLDARYWIVLNILILVIRYCFGFRASNFGFVFTHLEYLSPG